MLTLVNDKIAEHIKNLPSKKIPELQMTGKMLEQIDLIVKVKVNIHEVGFLNRDICRVLAHLDNGNLYIKRLEDGHKGIVSKVQVSFPKWENYSF
ncbi:hypothetical protein [Paenibacillus polymyxa]|uniref:Uncharacterized protein n=1 Tax=Paenibacillus polymyxa (strain SC2) TaxID=886882 RepID=E3EJP2_PAEPS|nr:hypothetical protein [Paenibacillus polymyxa]ADO59640.1 hypothetical protein PPSC2_26935 [Paenibacillus polymyxa SC2]WPQ59534.1 hypothetical protein SKN87_28130 [Paenibacillus polymyxa]